MANRKFSCYMSEELIADIDHIAERLELSRNRVIRMACRLLVKRFLDGSLDVQSYYEFLNKRYGDGGK